MFRVGRIGDNRIDIEMSGKLDSEQMKLALDELTAACEGIEHGRMLYDVIDYQFPSLSAIAVEFSRLPAMFGLIAQFDRVAVLADKSWLKRASEIEGALFPGLEIKAFGREQRAEAEAWLATEEKS